MSHPARIYLRAPVLGALIACSGASLSGFGGTLAHAGEHPLDPLSRREIKDSFQILGAYLQANHPGSTVLYPSLYLAEPPKAQVLAWKGGGQKPPRRAFAHVFLNRTSLYEAIVDLKTNKVISFVAKPGVQPPVANTEYLDADAMVHSNGDWQAMMLARGTNPDDVYVDVWSPGETSGMNEVVVNQPDCPGNGPRFLRALSFRKNSTDGAPQSNPYDRPVEGIVVTLDMTHLCVAQVLDCHGPAPLQSPQGGCYLAGQPAPKISRTTGNAARQRTDLKPLHTDTNGGSYRISGQEVEWQKWHFRFGMHVREGLFLYDVGFEDDQGNVRSIGYRLGMSEIYVPYGMADVNWLWRSAFDIGEYNLGQFANTLEKYRSVPGHTTLVSNAFATDTGDAAVYSDVVGIYERDGGILWARVDPSDYTVESRLGRELVVTYTPWIGNYLYGVDYIFRMDGTLEVKVNLIGTTLNQGVNTVAQGDKYGATALVDANGAIVAMPNHQHFLNFRLDLDIDGTANHVAESITKNAGVTKFPNAFKAVETDLNREGFRDASLEQDRHWAVESSTRENALGHHTGYAIHTHDFAFPYSGPGYPALERAQFAKHAFWVTKYRDGEMYAAGAYPNQGGPGEGLPKYANNEVLGNSDDTVAWLTIGHTHLPDPSQFPTMNLTSMGFILEPHQFFDSNPAMDAADQGR